MCRGVFGEKIHHSKYILTMEYQYIFFGGGIYHWEYHLLVPSFLGRFE